MNAVYREIFSVSLKHTYYLDGYCNDFDFVPTGECLKSLSRFGLLFRKNSYGISVLVPLLFDNDGKPKVPFEPFIAFDEAIKLEFAMIIKNLQFLNIASLNVLENVNYKNTLYYYSNLPGVTELNQLIVPTRPSLFTFYCGSGTRSLLNAELLDEHDNILLSKKIKESDVGKGNFSYNVDLNSFSSGIYKIRVSEEGIEEPFYVNDRLVNKPIFGIINISSEPGNLFDPASPASYEISFQPVEKQWKFYVISQSSFDDLKILDSADIPRYFFIEETPAPLNNARFFKSIVGPDGVDNNDKKWPYSEAQVTGIQLLDGNKVLIENVSLPNIKNPKAEIIIYV